MTTSPGKMRRLGANFLLLVTTFFWGTTFVIVKQAVEQVGVFLFLSQRFGLVIFCILLVICLILRRPFRKNTSGGVVIIGTLLFGSFAFQTMALLYTTASKYGIPDRP